MNKPSYKELEIQIAKLKKQIDFTLNNPTSDSHKLHTRTKELNESNEKLNIEEGKKVKLCQDKCLKESTSHSSQKKSFY